MNSSKRNPKSQSIRTNPFTSKFSLYRFWLPSLIILLLAFSFNLYYFPNTNYFKIQFLRTTLSSSNSLIPKFITSFLKSNFSIKTKPLSLPTNCVLWMAPFLSGGGYSSEAWSYITAIHDHNMKLKNPKFRLGIEQHGDLEVYEFWDGLSEESKKLAIEMYNTRCRMNETIVVCHSEPGAWYPPLFDTMPCPPNGYDEALFVIGRTMFETDRVNEEHVERCNRMEEVWVPTDFHVSTFVDSGVHASKVVKIVQPVDVSFFDPERYKPLDIRSIADIVLGTRSSMKGKEFVFLSIFKWEYRKGWDLLLKAYLKEFSKKDAVALYLLTNAYHSDSNFGSKIVDYVEHTSLEKPLDGWAPVYVIDNHIAQVDLPRLYKAADAFVLPSRGEGWGRPYVEAMAMSLPVIGTNWSGPTEYLTLENSYPLAVDEMSEVTKGPFKTHNWAEPSFDKLRGLMRHVISNPEEAKEKGVKAREDMIKKFSPEVVADIVVDHIMNIFNKSLKG